MFSLRLFVRFTKGWMKKYGGMIKEMLPTKGIPVLGTHFYII